jgi:glutamine synthetase
MSLFKNGKNAFHDESDPNGLSSDAYCFIAGLLKHAKAMTSITNPIINSYKRLVPGYEAPVYIAWSLANRSPLIRIPVVRGEGTRVELRNPDPSCNPYLALAAMLNAGIDGIKNKLTAPAPIDQNIYHMTDKELKLKGVDNLPTNLKEALSFLNTDDVIKNTLGEHILRNYTKAKEIECSRYTETVHEWEINEYIKAY